MKMKVFACRKAIGLAANIARYLEEYSGETCVVSKSENRTFANNEIMARPLETVRGFDTFIVQTPINEINDDFFEAMILADALKRASAKSITLVMPYLPYSRQDRKDKPREPITSRLIANFITAAGINRVITMKLHNPATQGNYDIPFDNISTTSLIMDYFEKKMTDKSEWSLVAADFGGSKSIRRISRKYGIDMAIFDKDRPGMNETKVMDLLGDVKGKRCILLDDMVDTGSSTIGAKDHLMNERGAKEVYMAATHAILSGNAKDKLLNAGFSEIVITDTIPQESDLDSTFKIISVAPQLADIIYRVHSSKSVAKLVEDF